MQTGDRFLRLVSWSALPLRWKRLFAYGLIVDGDIGVKMLGGKQRWNFKNSLVTVKVSTV